MNKQTMDTRTEDEYDGGGKMREFYGYNQEGFTVFAGVKCGVYSQTAILQNTGLYLFREKRADKLPFITIFLNKLGKQLL